MKNGEVADWMKAQADYTRDALAKIPQRDTVLKEVTAFGDAAAARVTSVQITGNNVYYLKRKADENIPKLYAREGFAGNERLLVDPDKLPAPEGSITRSTISRHRRTTSTLPTASPSVARRRVFFTSS